VAVAVSSNQAVDQGLNFFFLRRADYFPRAPGLMVSFELSLVLLKGKGSGVKEIQLLLILKYQTQP